jgi:hypothetical protein
MNTRKYEKQVQLLLSVLPLIAREKCFALHGGKICATPYSQLKTHRSSLSIYRTADDMIKSMLIFHPQRWNDKPIPWLKELVWQNQPVGGQV